MKIFDKKICSVFTVFFVLFVFQNVCFAQKSEKTVIAVPLPQIKSAQSSDEWIPQFMQDSLTTNFARYSKMTVIDRANESLALAEQKLSGNAQYDEESAIEIGKMTNAQLVLVGNIQVLSKVYSVNFRVNNIETNEIMSSYQNNYTLAQIESGAAVQEISKEVMLGLGIKLDASAVAALSKTNDKVIVANQNLAKGAVAEKNEDFINALAYFSLVQEADPTKIEAGKSIQNIFGGNISTQGLKAQLEYGKNMIAKWNKIFADLRTYMRNDDFFIVVYDFSNVETSISYGAKPSVYFKVTPGIKIFPNRAKLLVYKMVYDEWSKVSAKAENKEWVRDVNNNSPGYLTCYYHVALKDSYGDTIGDYNTYWDFYPSSRDEVLAQQKYYERAGFRSIDFNRISADKVTDNVAPKIIKFSTNSGKSEIHPRLFTVQEYEEWLAAGCP